MTRRVVSPQPGCPKKIAWKDRKDARESLLKRWANGDFTLNGTHWCKVHNAYHLTKKMARNGNNYLYRE